MNGAFGKVPSKADFARLGYSDAHTRLFESWLDEAALRMRELGAELPDAPVHFLFRFPGEPTVLVGAMRASRDSVGRRFPFSFFEVLDWRTVEHRWSGLPFAVSPALEAGAELLREAAHMDVESIRRRVETLWSPSHADLVRTDEICGDVLVRTRWLEPIARTLGEDRTLERAAYAFRTLKSAMALPNGIAECPVQVDVDLFFWLELSRRLGANDALHVVWTEEPVARAIVGVGSPSYSLLAAISDAGREVQQIWPLTTKRPVALEQAAAAIGLMLESTRETSIAELFATLGRWEER